MDTVNRREYEGHRILAGDRHRGGDGISRWDLLGIAVMLTPEGLVKKKLRKILASLPDCYFFFPATGGYGRSGVPDVVGSFRGRFFGIECKREGGVPTALQERELEAIRKVGGVAFIYDGSMSTDALVVRLAGKEVLGE